MELVEHTDDEPISIARCRELLGEQAESMTDQEVALIRRAAPNRPPSVLLRRRVVCARIWSR